MAKIRVSDLGSATTPLAGTEELLVVQAGVEKKVVTAQLVRQGVSETVTGVKTFASPPSVPSPSGASDATPKSYVDGVAAGAPIGTMVLWPGIFAPVGWVFGRGQALDRTIYSDLNDMYNPVATASTTSGSATISSVSVDFSGATIGVSLVGAKIEGAGIPAGASITATTSTTITISANATATATGVSIRIFPNGNGDGSTTFNVPDMSGAAPAGAGTSTGYTQNETLALGTKYNDQMQGHGHIIIAGVDSVQAGASAISTLSNLSGGNRGDRADVIESDGTNGTPRTGNVTRGKRVGVNFIIKAV